MTARGQAAACEGRRNPSTGPGGRRFRTVAAAPVCLGVPLRRPGLQLARNWSFDRNVRGGVVAVRCEGNGTGSANGQQAAPARSNILKGAPVLELRVDEIRRPLARTRSNDPEKVQWLMESISDIGLQVPIDVLEVDGVYYGFSGCHRYEAHQRLGLEFIKCRVRKATKATLRMHMM